MYTSVWLILNEERYSGVTLHYMERGIDTGNIIAQKKFCIEGMDCRDLYQANMKYGKELILENIEELIMGMPTSYPQPVGGYSYYSKYSIDYSQLKIDLNQTAETICNQIRAFSYREFQLPEVYTHKIIDAKVMPEKSKGKSGTIIMETPEVLLINTIDYNVVMFFDRLDELMQACGRGDMYTIKSICTVSKHVNDYDVAGRTPLAAILADEKEAVKFLLTQGADVNAVDNNGRTVLMYAETAYVKHHDSTIFRLLEALGVKWSWRIMWDIPNMII